MMRSKERKRAGVGSKRAKISIERSNKDLAMNWRSVVSIFFILALIAMQIVYWINPVTLYDVLDLRHWLFSFIDHNPQLSALVYILFYILSIVFGIPISITIIGGYFFGALNGFIYSIISILIGTTALCFLARYVLRDWITQRYQKQLEPLQKEIEKYGLVYIVFIHMLPFVPSLLPHLAAGISSIPLYQIVGANVVGALPLTLIYSVAGTYIHQIGSWQSFMVYVAIFGALIASFSATVFAYWRWRK